MLKTLQSLKVQALFEKIGVIDLRKMQPLASLKEKITPVKKECTLCQYIGLILERNASFKVLSLPFCNTEHYIWKDQFFVH